MKIHALADLVPRMDGDQFATLLEDIRVNGPLEPITLFEGKVLDGRHRLAACNELGIKAKTVTFEGTEAEAARLVVSKNLARRHLEPRERLAAAEKLLPFFRAEAQQRKREAGKRHGRGRSKKVQASSPGPKRGGAQATDEAGRAAGVSGRSLRRFLGIRERAPEVADLVSQEELTLPQAERLSKLPKRERASLLAKGKKVGLANALKATENQPARGRERLHGELKAALDAALAVTAKLSAALTSAKRLGLKRIEGRQTDLIDRTVALARERTDALRGFNPRESLSVRLAPEVAGRLRVLVEASRDLSPQQMPAVAEQLLAEAIEDAIDELRNEA